MSEDAFDELRALLDLDIEMDGIDLEFVTDYTEDEYFDLEEDEFYDELLDEDYDID